MYGAHGLARLVAVSGVYVAAALAMFAVFVAARTLVSAALRVRGRLAPFGEAPLASLAAVSLRGRVAIALAGPLAAYLFVTALGTLGLCLSGVMTDATLSVEVLSSYPAAAAGVRDGDRIVSVGGVRVTRFSELKEKLEPHAGRPVSIGIEREGRSLELTVTPRARGTSSEGRIGVYQRRESIGVAGAARMAAPVPFITLAWLAQWVWAPAEQVAGPVALIRWGNAAASRSAGEFLWVLAIVVGYWTLDGLLLAALLLLPWRRRSSGTPPVPAGAASSGVAAATAAAAAVPVDSLRPTEARPWVRALARAVDLTIFWVVLSLVVQVAASAERALHAAGALFFLTWAPLEAVMLATWGFTPGKWLLRVSVRDGRGDKLEAREALRRSVAVWTFGLGVGHLFGLVTGVLAYRRLRRAGAGGGAAYWDALEGHRVSHGAIGALRAAIAVVIVAVMVAAMIASAALSR